MLGSPTTFIQFHHSPSPLGDHVKDLSWNFQSFSLAWWFHFQFTVKMKQAKENISRFPPVPWPPTYLYLCYAPDCAVILCLPLLNGTPLQYSCLENPMDRGAWWAAVHGVTRSRTRLSEFTFTFHFPALEKEMATHSSVLAWRIPGMGEPGGLPFMGSHRVGHNWSDLA